MNTSEIQKDVQNLYASFIDKSDFSPIDVINGRILFEVHSINGAKKASLLARYFNMPAELRFPKKEELSSRGVLHTLMPDEKPCIVQSQPIQPEMKLEISEQKIQPVLQPVSKPKPKNILNLKHLGMDESQLAMFSKALKNSTGLILLTGLEGSGKTTTLYAALLEGITKGLNILTIEDTIEHQIDGITQVELSSDTHIAITSAINVNLCKDTNIVLIDEIRDTEGTQSALLTSLGHLVISTLNTTNVSQAAQRMIEMRIEPFLLASSLILIIGQRLIKKICQRCKYPVEMDVDIRKAFSRQAYSEFSKSKVDPAMEDRLNDVFSKHAALSLKNYYRGAGCVDCQNSGYDGYTAIFEFMPIDDGLRKLIIRNAAPSEINAYAINKGMDSMVSKGLTLVANGITTPEQVKSEK
jgi:general secretion pathway protein E